VACFPGFPWFEGSREKTFAGSLLPYSVYFSLVFPTHYATYTYCMRGNTLQEI
jgi:hypothetical protein